MPLDFDILEPNWKRASETLLPSRPWARALVDAIEKDALAWSRCDIIPGPSTPTGWTHNYFCAQCGEPLVFDPDKPREHLARKCDKIYTGDDYDGAWCTLAHNTNAVQMERLAVLLNLGIHADASRLQLLRFVEEYSTRYGDYPQKAPWNGRWPCRMMGSSLDESVWTISFFRALRWSRLADELSPAIVKSLTKMATMVVDLIRPLIVEKQSIHNITCWMLGALAQCAWWLGDRKLLEWTWSNPVGVSNQLMFGLRGDGLWHEGSTHYHHYTLAALMSFFEVASTHKMTPALMSRLTRAFRAPVRLMYSDGRIPSYNDGWWLLSTDNTDLYEVAAHICDQRSVHEDLANLYQHTFKGKPRVFSRSFNPMFGYSKTTDLDTRASVASLLFGPDQLPPAGGREGSALLSYSGIGILANAKVRVAMRFGPFGGGHDHRDRLGVDVEAGNWQSLDVGTSGYAAEITQIWQKTGASHNMVMIDGDLPLGSAGEITTWTPECISVESSESYRGVNLRRTIKLNEDSWTDVYEISANEPRRIDWCFHGDGQFTPEAPDERIVPASFEGERATGLECIVSPRRITNAGTIKGNWTFDQGRQDVEIVVPEGFDLYWGKGMCNPNGRDMGVVVIRGRSAQAVITARFPYH